MNTELSKRDADMFKKFLKSHNIKYEASEAFNLIHFECYVSDEEAALCDDFLHGL